MLCDYKKILLPIFSYLSLNACENFIAPRPLTAQENACFNWFNEQFDLKKAAIEALKRENHEVLFAKSLKYFEHPDKVQAALQNLAEEFYKKASEHSIVIPSEYNQEFLTSTLLRIKMMMQEHSRKKSTD